MLPSGINPKQMKKMMKKMGISSEDIEAEQVIIRCVDREIVIENPSVVKTNMQGQQIFQIQGDVSESKVDDSVDISQEDVELVMAQANVSEENAIKALDEADGDLAEAILKLKS